MKPLKMSPVPVSPCCSFQTTPTTTFQNTSTPPYPHLGEFNYLIYGLVMSFILFLGFFGNVLTIIVLRQKEHRKKMIVPFIINLAAADVFIVVFGYPIAVSSILSKDFITLERTRCKWSAFVNSSIGIASIITFTVMSILMCHSVTNKKTTRRHFSNKTYVVMMLAIWGYGILTSCPPLLGWSTFVPGFGGISCGPKWASNQLEDRAYNAFLVFTGFVLPLIIIITCYSKIFRVLRIKDYSSKSNKLREAWQRSQKKIVQMIGFSVAAFIFSWTPYCIVSVVSAIKGKNDLSPLEAEIPELMAKASVIYNPFVYTMMNARFRRSLKILVFRSLKIEQREENSI
ncbi:rhodopsin, G0-coupled-like [Actinia tenebrosa]|uniref:Rhodopsin, G0-coupled-like n=1 Tax=Actinia tenebrosa TaxID=6105 RepID=A0A6P8I6J8_ACTTE|nr:rhodopsin, G0-coupled-like [Actinia tenebrosa]